MKRAVMSEGKPSPPDDLRHGTTNGYGNHGCRCLACREANRLTHSMYMAKVRKTGQLAEGDVTHGTSYR